MGEERVLQNHIIQYVPEYSVCTGCHSCEIVCSLIHDKTAGPGHGRIQCEFGKVNQMLHTVHACQQCEDHPCYEACPKKDKAMRLHDNGVVYVVEEECIGCGLCQKACVFEPSRIAMSVKKDPETGKKSRKAKKCDLCYGREEGPACIQFCPVRCLGLSEDPLPEIKTEFAQASATDGVTR